MTTEDKLVGKYVLVTYGQESGVYCGTVTWASGDGRSLELKNVRYVETDPPNEFLLLRLATFGEISRRGKIKPSYTASHILLLDNCRMVRICTDAVGEKIMAHPFEA